MPLPPGRARAFEAAGKQGFVWGWEAGNKGLVSAADRAYMKAPVPRLPSPAYGTKCPTPLDAVTICVATPIYFRGRTFLKIEMGGKAILGLSCLDYPSAKVGETVNGGAESAVHLDR